MLFCCRQYFPFTSLPGVITRNMRKCHQNETSKELSLQKVIPLEDFASPRVLVTNFCIFMFCLCDNRHQNEEKLESPQWGYRQKHKPKLPPVNPKFFKNAFAYTVNIKIFKKRLDNFIGKELVILCFRLWEEVRH